MAKQKDPSERSDKNKPEQEPAEQSTAPKSSSVLWANWRQGLKDLQNVVLNPFPGHVAQHEEQGTIANPTPQDVYQDRTGNEHGVHGPPDQAAGNEAKQAEISPDERMQNAIKQASAELQPNTEPRRDALSMARERAQQIAESSQDKGRYRSY